MNSTLSEPSFLPLPPVKSCPQTQLLQHPSVSPGPWKPAPSVSSASWKSSSVSSGSWKSPPASPESWKSGPPELRKTATTLSPEHWKTVPPESPELRKPGPTLSPEIRSPAGSPELRKPSGSPEIWKFSPDQRKTSPASVDYPESQKSSRGGSPDLWKSSFFIEPQKPVFPEIRKPGPSGPSESPKAASDIWKPVLSVSTEPRKPSLFSEPTKTAPPASPEPRKRKGRRWSPPGTLDGPGRCGGGEWVQGLTEGRSEDALGAWSIGRVRDGHNQAPPTAVPHLPPPPGNSSQRKPDLAGS